MNTCRPHKLQHGYRPYVQPAEKTMFLLPPLGSTLPLVCKGYCHVLQIAPVVAREGELPAAMSWILCWFADLSQTSGKCTVCRRDPFKGRGEFKGDLFFPLLALSSIIHLWLHSHEVLCKALILYSHPFLPPKHLTPSKQALNPVPISVCPAQIPPCGEEIG